MPGGGPGRGNTNDKTVSKIGNQGLQNLNGDLLCAIDTETTGFTAGFHDLVEVAVIPLNYAMERLKDAPVFNILIRPKRPQNADPKALEVNGLKLEQLALDGLDSFRAGAMFERWFEKLELAPGKKIAPLAKNWSFDKPFFEDWLGPDSFRSYFSHRYRDVQPVVAFFNDRSEFHAVKAPFPNASLGSVASALNIHMDRAHRALDDAMATAKVYERLMRVRFE